MIEICELMCLLLFGVFWVFEVVVCYESFLCVVMELFVMYGVVSYQMCILEDELGVLLFEWCGKCVMFMYVGCVYVDWVCEVFDQIVQVMY